MRSSDPDPPRVLASGVPSNLHGELSYFREAEIPELCGQCFSCWTFEWDNNNSGWAAFGTLRCNSFPFRGRYSQRHWRTVMLVLDDCSWRLVLKGLVPLWNNTWRGYDSSVNKGRNEPATFCSNKSMLHNTSVTRWGLRFFKAGFYYFQIAMEKI